MEIFIEWDEMHYPHLCTDYAVSEKAAKLVERAIKIVDEIQGTKTKKYFITKANLDYLRNKNIQHYTTEQSKVCGKWFDKLAEEIFNYIIDGSEETSFLKYFDNDGHYKGN